MYRFVFLPIFIFFSIIFNALGFASCSPHTFDFTAKTIPQVKSYENVEDRQYQINQDTRFIISKAMYEATDSVHDHNIRTFFYNLAAEYYEKMQQYDSPLANAIPIIVKTASYQEQKGDIEFQFVDNYETVNNHTFQDITSLESYQIKVADHIMISALNNPNIGNKESYPINGLYYAAMTLLQLQFTNYGINYGTITDWPKVAERGIYFDFSGRGYSSDFVDKLIRECAWNKLNTIGLRFASGGVHINTHKDVPPGEQDGTYFMPDWSNYSYMTTTPAPAFVSQPFNINTNYADPDVPWDWNGPHSEFGKLLTLAKLDGIQLIPEMNVFSHAWFITDLTCPKNQDGTRKTSGFVQSEWEYDFAVYNTDHTRRIPDAVNLTGDTIGSKVAIDLIKTIVSYYADLFKKEGIKEFSIGGDEYIENFRWQNLNIDAGEKQKVVDGYYSLTHELDDLLMQKGLNSQQWNDDIFRNIRNQDLSGDFGFPATSQDNSDSVIRSDETTKTIKQIKYWWKGVSSGMNPLASIDDFVNGSGTLGGGIESIINYDYYNLYFCDDDHSVRVPDAKNLYDSWHPGIFSRNHEVADSPFQTYLDNQNGFYPSWVGGAMMSVWWDYAPWVMSTVYGPLKSFSQKSWNGTDKVMSFDDFQNVVERLGHGIGI